LRPKPLDPTNPAVSKPLDSGYFRRRFQLFALLLGAFALKAIVLLQLRDHLLLQPDSGLDTTAYVNLAQKVMSGDWALGPGLYFVSPLYIYFLAFVLAVFDSFTALRFIQIALGTASIACIFFMAREWFGETAAWIAAVLATLTGLFTFYEVLILQSSIDAFLTAAALWSLTVALRSTAVRRFLLPGAVLGLQTMNRPNMLVAALGLAGVLLLARRPRAAVWLAAGIALGVAPAAIRNAAVAHQFSLVSSHGGLNFYIGNNAAASGFYQFVAGVTPTIAGQETDTRRVAERALGRSLTDAEVSGYFFDQAWQWIRHNPAAALGLFARKLGYAFHAQHIALPHSYPFYAFDERTALRFYVIGPWLLTPLGLVGLIAAAPRDRLASYLVWAAFVPLYAVSVAMFFVAERYRLPLLPSLCVAAGGALSAGWRASKARRIGAVLAGVAAAGLLGLAANTRTNATDGRWVEGLRLAQRLAMLKRYPEADAWVARLDASHPPRPGAGHAGLGMQLLEMKDASRALPYLQAAQQSDPADARLAFALGQALLRTGDATTAVAHLRRGFESGLSMPDGGLDYAVALSMVGQADAARAAALRITPANPDDYEGWLSLGRLAMEARAPAVAEPFFHRATIMRPDVAAARQQYGLNLLVSGRLEDAYRELSEAVRLDPRNADSLSHLAYCEISLNKPEAARSHVRAALALSPDDPLARQLATALGMNR
jgi:tetratricopeptide (TPR) repeat protein